MNNTELQLERPWLLLLLIPAILLILIPFLRYPAKRRKTFQKIVPTVIHCIVALLLVLLLTGVRIVRSTDNQAVVLVLDYSASTQSVRDSINADAGQLQQLLQKNAPVQIVAFGGDSVYTSKNLSDLTPVDANATDLASALEYAATLLPDDRVGRIIVLSDGKQTDGDAAGIAQYLYSQGVRVDAMWFDSAVSTSEVQISSFAAPESAFPGKPMTFTAELESNTADTVSLTLYDGETEIESRSVQVDEGISVLSLDVPGTTAGTHHYRLMLKAEKDTVAQNNLALATVEVAQAPSLLILTGIQTNAAAFEDVLEGYAQTTVMAASKAPRKIAELCKYDAVLLMNVHAEDLPNQYDAILSSYVQDYGKSLIAFGGEDTFMYGSMRNTDYEAMMPVNFSLSRTSEDDSVALMLVIDCSLSMSQQSEYMSVAKQGAIKCVQSMTENDYVGIISFNLTAAVEAPLEKNTDQRKDLLNRIISGLTTSQGTYYTDALALAHQELLKSDAPIRHILFVSDGGPADTSYAELIPGIAADGISISTIALSYDSTVLSKMADNSGGSYYHIQQATELPDIMLSLTQHVSANSFMTGDFSAAPVAGSPLADQLPATLPGLKGYLGTTLKRGAELHITVGENHPLYTSWTWGKGTVACFASDLNTGWGSAWLAEKDLIGKLLTYVLPESRSDSSMFLEMAPGGQSVQLTVRTASDEESTLTVQSGDTTLRMTRIAAGVYRQTLSAVNVGSFPVTVTQTYRHGKVVDTLSRTLNIPVQVEYDAFTDNGQALMKNVCLNGGGILTGDKQTLLDVSVDKISAILDFRMPFGIAVVVLLLADIAIRKLRWKDLKNLWLCIVRKK